MASGLRLSELLDPDSVLLPLRGDRGDDVLRELAELAAARGWVSDAKELHARLSEREALGTTAVGDDIAIPHAKVEELRGVRFAIGVSPAGIPFGAADGRPTRLFFLVLSSPRVPSLHIQVLAQVSRLARTAGLKQALLAAPDRGSLVALVADAEAGERA